MSEEVPEQPETAEFPEDHSSPLNVMLHEIHEVYQELTKVGFEERIATLIVAHMIQDAMLYRPSDDENDDTEDINDEEDIEDDDRGPI